MDEEEEKDEVQYVKLVWKNPNPLFVKWITEWMEEARRRNLQLQYTLENALGSLKKFPIPLKSGKECLILEHFGSALCDKLDRELAKYNANKHDTSAISGPSTSGNNRLAIKDFENKTKNETNIVPKPAAVLNHDVQSPKKSLEIKTKSPKKLFWDKPSASTLFDKPSHKNLFEYDTPVPNKLTQTKKPETVRSSFEGIFGPSTSSALNHLNTNEAYQFPPDNDRNVATTSFEHLTAVSRKETNLLPYRRKDAEGSPQKNGYPRRKPAALGAASESSTCEGTIDWEPKRLQNERASPTKRKLTVPSPKKSPHKRNQRENPSLFADDNDTAPLSQLSSNGSCSQTVEEPFTFPPGDFVIKLLVDTAETFGNTAKRLKRQEEATTYLTELGVLFEVRRLPVGDFVWVCQDGSPKELLLPYIVERKRADDLAKSIKDGRFREQKFRLKQLPITHRIYLVEELKGDRSGLPLSTLMQAATNTQVIDGFKVTFTKNLKHSMQYLATMTEYLTETFNRKMLMSCSKERLPPLNLKDDYCLLMTFKDYARNTAKKRKYTVGEMFLKHLLQLRGMSVEKAKAVVRLYPTPSHLMEAYRNCQRSKRRMMLSKLQIGALGRSLGPVISVAIHDLYTKNEFN